MTEVVEVLWKGEKLRSRLAKMLEIFIIAQVREDDGLNQDIGNNDELEKFRKYIFYLHCPALVFNEQSHALPLPFILLLNKK